MVSNYGRYTYADFFTSTSFSKDLTLQIWNLNKLTKESLSKIKKKIIKYDKSYFTKKIDAPVIRIDRVFNIKLDEIKKNQLNFKIKFITSRFIIYLFNYINPKILENIGIFIEKNKMCKFWLYTVANLDDQDEADNLFYQPHWKL